MKTKTFDKKLVLNKKTISSLNTDSMDDIKGGVTEATCMTCLTPRGGTFCIACYQEQTYIWGGGGEC